MLRSIVIGNYIAVTTDRNTSIHRGKGRNMLFVILSQQVHNKMPMLPLEETLLGTCEEVLYLDEFRYQKTNAIPEFSRLTTYLILLISILCVCI